MTGNNKGNKKRQQEMTKDTFEVLHEFYNPAKANVSNETWDYLMGGGETEATLERNRMALDQIVFRPRVLRNVEKVNARATIFGHDARLPRRQLHGPVLGA